MSTRWFEQGADAFARVVKGMPRGYVCPLCLRLFTADRIGELRVDHVPAEAFGGSGLVLTCHSCNSNSGAFLQSEMKKRDNPAAVLRGELTEPRPVRVTTSTGLGVNAEMLGGPDGALRLSVVERANSTAARDAFTRHLNDLTESGATDWALNLDFYANRHHSVPAHVGWLREAFLIAFVVLGYRYILDPSLRLVREQLARPTEELISLFTIYSPEKSMEERQFLIVSEPKWLRSVAIQLGRRTIFLPALGDPGIYERLGESRKNSADGRLKTTITDASIFPWPRQPQFLMDFQLSQPVFGPAEPDPPGE